MYRKSERKIARLELLDELDQEQITALQRLAFSRNSEIRVRAAVLLALWCDERSEEILYHLTFDRDEVVRLGSHRFAVRRQIHDVPAAFGTAVPP